MAVRRSKAAVGVSLVAALAALGGTAATTASAGASAAAAAAKSPWTQVSSGAVGTISNIGLGRFGSTVQAVWVQQVGGGNQSLETRIVGSDGVPTAPAVAAAANWATLDDFPAIFSNGSSRVIAFSGLQNTDTSNPYAQGYEYSLTSADGNSWTLSQGALSADNSAYGSYGTDAIEVSGQPLVAYTAGSASAISYHSGELPSIPVTPPIAADPTTTAATKCCTYDTGLGYDAKAGQTWAVWYSQTDAKDAATQGILAQPIEPALGTQIQGPGSLTHSHGSYDALEPSQRIVTADRAGGGVYAAYGVGFPTASKVALWKLGAKTALTLGTGGNAQRVGTAADSDGRVWLYWWDESSHSIETVRTNSASTRFGSVCKVATPGDGDAVWDLVGNAAGGPLQLFALAGTSHPQVYDAIVKPCLTVTVAPTALTATKGGAVQVKVSDAGASVRGATVVVGGKSAKTNAQGIAVVSVAKHHATGRIPVTASASGYQTATTTLRLR